MSAARLRVAMLTSCPLPPREGIGTYVSNLAQELVSRGHAVTVLTRGRAAKQRRFDVNGVQVIELPFVPVYPLHVNVHGLFVSSYLRKHTDGFDLVHAHSPLVPPVRVPCPLITTLHSRLASDAQETTVQDLRTLLTRMQSPISAHLERQLLARSSMVVVVNPLIVEALAHDFEGRLSVRVQANAVDVLKFRPPTTSRAEGLVLAVGRLVHGKGWEDLLTAWVMVHRHFPDARLTIVGDGPLKSRLIEQCSSLGISASVRFYGEITMDRRPEMIDLYQRTGVVVQPSHHEGLSTVILEAMACAAPVVATSVGAHSLVIADGRNGRLIAPRQPEAMARAIGDVLGDTAAAADMGARGRETVVRSYSWASAADSYLAIYKELLECASDAR